MGNVRSYYDQCTAILLEMADILTRSGNAKHWEKRLHSLANNSSLQGQELTARIKQLYGGDNSITHLHIQLPNGDMDFDKAEHFAKLTTKLYCLASKDTKILSAESGIMPLIDPTTRLRIKEREDGFFAISEDHYDIIEDEYGTVCEIWIENEAEGLFETFALAEKEALARASSS